MTLLEMKILDYGKL